MKFDFNGDPLSDLGVGPSSCRACGTLPSEWWAGSTDFSAVTWWLCHVKKPGWDDSESLKLDGGDSSCPFFVADVLVKRQILTTKSYHVFSDSSSDPIRLVFA
jgi:hypothetical protein